MPIQIELKQYVHLKKIKLMFYCEMLEKLKRGQLEFSILNIKIESSDGYIYN